MRTIIIGDIHGDYKCLKELLKKISFKKAFDKLIILGDFIDKGEESYEVINYFYHLKKEMKNNLILIKGNHEYEFLNKNIIKKIFLICLGRNKTKKSFKKNKQKINYYNDWLNKNLVNYYENKDFQCCHASIKNEKIKENKNWTLVVNHFYSYSNKYNGKLTIIGHLGLKLPIYFPGKEARQILEYNIVKKIPKKGIISIDTIGGKKLTAMIIEDDCYYLEYVERG